jgi:hypothetical protein
MKQMRVIVLLVALVLQVEKQKFNTKNTEN